MTVVQNVDRNTSIKDYADCLPNELKVFKIFGPTIQGEGPFAGRKAVFLRLAGCNKGDKLSCPWCDTAFQIDRAKVMNFYQIAQEVSDVWGSTTVNWANPAAAEGLLIITGGEPTMQENLGAFINFFNTSYPLWTIQIESNGDRPIFRATSKFILVVSPKVNPSSQRYMELRRTVLEQVSILKFVVSADPQSPYHSLPAWAELAASTVNTKVYISPITVYKREVQDGEVPSLWDGTLIDREETRRNYQRALDLCYSQNYIISVQKHLLFGVE